MPASSSTTDKRRWDLPSSRCPTDWQEMSRDWGVPVPVLDVLWNRGLRSRDDIDRFLRPKLEHLHDPFLLTDCERAVERVARSMREQRTIFVFGDYDVDGISAAALWTRVLRRQGATVVPWVPNRMTDGFGLTVGAVDRALDAGADLLVTNDCGTSAHEAIEHAVRRGLDVIVTDHHMPESVLPPAYAVVNPRREDDTYPFPELAAVGVAFKVLQGLLERHGTAEDRKFLFNQLDLVSLGTIADVVPLQDENRVFVHYGVRILRVRRRAAFDALFAQARLGEKFVEASHLAFSVVPRINAAGRLGCPEKALDLLLCEDPKTAAALAEQLEVDNSARRVLNERVLEEALAQLDPTEASFGSEAIVLGSVEWHPGVLGIAASRLVDQYGLPVFLCSLEGEIGRGSARGPDGIDLLGLLEAAGAHLAKFGGHKQAAGFSVEPAEFVRFQEVLRRASRDVLTAPRDEASWDLDGALPLETCDQDLAQWIERLGPFGEGNAEPLFATTAEVCEFRVLGERHLRLVVRDRRRRFECIGFGLAPAAEGIPKGGGCFRLAFTPTVNRYRGQERLQLKLRGIEIV